ncbi:MAG: MFS transporter, partial [Chloroflexi bacterium]
MYAAAGSATPRAGETRAAGWGAGGCATRTTPARTPAPTRKATAAAATAGAPGRGSGRRIRSAADERWTRARAGTGGLGGGAATGGPIGTASRTALASSPAVRYRLASTASRPGSSAVQSASRPPVAISSSSAANARTSPKTVSSARSAPASTRTLASRRSPPVAPSSRAWSSPAATSRIQRRTAGSRSRHDTGTWLRRSASVVDSTRSVTRYWRSPCRRSPAPRPRGGCRGRRAARGSGGRTCRVRARPPARTSPGARRSDRGRRPPSRRWTVSGHGRGDRVSALVREEAPLSALGGGARAWVASLSPLRHPVFRWIWIASVASQLGTWIQNVGAVDQMTALAPTAFMLAVVQTAMSLPGLLFALPAGALADMVDRRRLLVAASGWMCVVSALLALTSVAHLMSPALLLALTFAIGLGTVAGLPAWQAVIPELVPRRELAQAVTLSSVAINLARVTGPALGGVAVALAGPAAAFGLTALAFATTSVVVLRWRRKPHAAPALAQGMVRALRFGLRYSVANAPVRSTLGRAACFILFGSALWALMPVVSRQFDMGFAGYSGLLGSL